MGAALKIDTETEDRVRAALQWAFSEKASTPGSIFEVFSGKKTKESTLRPSRRSDGLSATRIHAVESARQGSAKIPISSGRSGGDIRRAIYSLPALQQNWVNHCYNPSSSKKIEAGKVLLSGLWDQYLAQGDTAGVHARSKTIVTFMLHIQLQQARSYAGLQRWSESMPGAFQGVISRSSWCDTHRDRWRAVHGMIINLDHTAIRGIAEGAKIKY